MTTQTSTLPTQLDTTALELRDHVAAVLVGLGFETEVDRGAAGACPRLWTMASPDHVQRVVDCVGAIWPSLRAPVAIAPTPQTI